jgi:hypothetical protein
MHPHGNRRRHSARRSRGRSTNAALLEPAIAHLAAHATVTGLQPFSA